MRISNQTLKLLLIAIAGIVNIFLTFQIMTGGIVWLEWVFLLASIYCTLLFSKVPQRRKRPLLGLYGIIFTAFPFAFVFLRGQRALELILLTLTMLLITFIAASIVAIFYPRMVERDQTKNWWSREIQMGVITRTPKGRRLVRILIFSATLIGGSIGLYMNWGIIKNWSGIPY